MLKKPSSSSGTSLFFVGGLFAVLLLASAGWAQTPMPSIPAGETRRILSVLAADSMRGRRVFTTEIDRAADFIASEFRAAGLKPWNNSDRFLQEFALIRPRTISLKAWLDTVEIDPKQVCIVSAAERVRIQEGSGYETAYIRSGQNLLAEARKWSRQPGNRVVWVDKSHAASFSGLARLRSSFFKTPYTVAFILSDLPPAAFLVESTQEISEQVLSNVVGVLPGRSGNLTGEYVVFSAHYDHLGVGRPVNGDSIYNGANDDATGVTAVIQLARYFREAGTNARTLVFVAFTAEESGGFGSQYFSRTVDPDRVSAMLNIEMIGTESKWGAGSAYITGYEKSTLGQILSANLKGSGFDFYADPYPQQQLFYRSDNATLARLGVPAHTLSTSKMDTEPHYHRPSDEVATLDLENMTAIIRAIALSAASLVAGKDTPSRVNTGELR